MNSNMLTTRDKIMDVASGLFAQRGFPGTSVRDIARAAEVNLASINYHFETKENLLFEILKCGHQQLRTEIEKVIGNNQDNIEEIFVELFKLFLEHDTTITNNMQLILSEQSLLQEDYGFEVDVYGPPGGKKLAQAFQANFQKKLSHEDLSWAIQGLFSIVFHQALMLSSVCGKQAHFKKIINPELVIKRLRRTIRVFLTELD